MQHVKDSLAAFLAGEMAPTAASAVQDHLDGCRTCRAELEVLREVWASLGAAAPAAGARPTQWPAIHRRTFGQGARPAAWFFGRGALSRAGLAGVAVAAGLGLGIWVPGGGPGGGAGGGAGSVTTAAGTADGALESASLDSPWSGSTWLDSTQRSRLSDLWLSAGQADGPTDGPIDEGSGS